MNKTNNTMKRLLKFRKKLNKTVKKIAKKGLYNSLSYYLYNGKRMLYI